jgi:hypothetical protein
MIRIKDWNRFQHFKDRRPPWIKLYRDLLEDPDWHELDPLAAKVLTMLWLVASEDSDQEGQLPDIRRLSFRLRMEELQLKQALTKLEHWLIFDDDTVISHRHQDDAPETETETETEAKPRAKRPGFVKPSKNEIALYAAEMNYAINAEKFFNYYEANGWKVGRNKMNDWKAAVRNWASNDFNKSTTIETSNREVAL